MSNAATGPKDRLVQASEDAERVLGKSASGRRLASLGKLEVPADALRALPLDFVKQHRILPIGLHNGTIEIATADPGNQRVIEDIRLLSGLEVQEFEAPVAEILEKMAECYQMTVEKMIENLNPEQAVTTEGRTLHDIEVMANEPSVINLVNVINSKALGERTKDINLVRRLMTEGSLAITSIS